METTRVRGCLAAALAAAVAAGAWAGAAPAAAPAGEAEAQWGAPAGGVQTSLEVEPGARVGGRLVFRLSLRGAGGQGVRIGPAKGAFGWLVIVQNVGDAKQAYYSEKVVPVAAEWPDELAAGKVVTFKPIDLAGAAAYPSSAARELLLFYLSGEGADDLPKPAGKLGEVLAPGRAMAKFALCLPWPGERPTPAMSNAVEVVIAPPDFTALPPDERKAFVADLLKQFDRSAWGGKQAHDTAVGLGREIVPDLIAAVSEPGRPDFSRMWLATALADIPDPRAADALVKLLDDPEGGVRAVAAYHGPKQESAKLDQAIAAKVQTAAGTDLAALALLGYLVGRGEVPEAILGASLESADPRARAGAAQALAGHASERDVARLAALLEDKDARVRGTAAAVLGKMKVRAPGILGALVRALDLPGEGARERVAAALGELTGRQGPYDPKADEAARRATIAGWKDWWAKEGPKPSPGGQGAG